MRRARVFTCLGVTLLASAAYAQSSGTPASGAGAGSAGGMTGPAQPDSPDAQTLSGAALLATGLRLGDDRANRIAADIASGKTTLAGFLDELLRSRPFEHEIVPQLVLKEASAYNVRIHEGLVLERTNEDGKDIYHWGGRPCSASDAVSVTPWWDLRSKVLVCEDAYRPDVFTTSNPRIHCSAAVGWGSQGVARERCGCGPYLVRCLRDENQRAEMTSSVLGEVKDTIGYVVEHDRSFADAFVSSSTFRGRYAELLIRRDAIERREVTRPPNLADWPEEGKYAPRFENYPGEQAGILTTPLIRWTQDAKRAVMKIVFDIMWCIPPSSIGVNTDAILGMGTGDIRTGGSGASSVLARMPVCTGCHARLDYATPFFASFDESGFAMHAGAQKRNSGMGPIYGLDINDHRADADLTPREFAKVAVAQPEFSRCMAQDIGTHVFGQTATSADLNAIQNAFSEHSSFRAAFRQALVRWVARAPSPEAPMQVSPELPASDANGIVPVGRALRSELNAHCVPCHSGPPNGSFTDPTVSRETMLEILNRVSFKTMPRGEPLSATDRDQLLSAGIESLWTGPTERREAEAYFIRWDRAERSVGMENSLRALAARIGADAGSSAPSALDSLVSGEYRQLTPGYATVLALQALDMCRAAGYREGEARDRCLSHALAIQEHILPAR